ncbi:MAG: glycosyltransferase family 4 protein [Cyanobacteria bacterium J06638_7]
MSASWPARVLVLAPQVWGAEGGVQRYGRSLLAGLAALRPGASVELLALRDRPRRWPRLAMALEVLAAALPRPGRPRPQLVLCTHLHLAPLALLAARLAGARLWVVAHGIEVWAAPLKGLRSRALLAAHRLLPVSRYTAERLREQLCAGVCRGGEDLPPWSLLPNTYDARRFCPAARPPALIARYRLQDGQPLIFCLTRLSRGDRAKHLDRLIAAMAELRRSHPDAVLLIGGDGDDRPRLQALAREWGVADAVLFPGRLADAELADHYHLASVFALPSAKEGFGIVFLEALGCGRPVLAGNRDGSRDPLADGRFGLLVDPDQPLAPHLRALLERRGEPLWFDPPALSASVAERFAFPAFCRRLDQLLRAEAELGAPEAGR